MGLAANAGRRPLLEKVRDCVSLVNECLTDVRAVQQRHNAFTEQVSSDIKALKVDNDQIARDSNRAVALASLELRRLIAEAEARVTNLQRATFWQRLRWLVTGILPPVPMTPEDLRATTTANHPRLAESAATFARPVVKH